MLPVSAVIRIACQVDLLYPFDPFVSPLVLRFLLKGEPSRSGERDIVHIAGHDNITAHQVIEWERSRTTIMRRENNRAGAGVYPGIFDKIPYLYTLTKDSNIPPFDTVEGHEK